MGNLGAAQPDFNLMGQVFTVDDVAQLTYSLNGGPENADITIEDLHLGGNEIAISATDANGHVDTQTLIVERLEGDSTRPFSIVWNEIENPQDVGQYVDGHWTKGPYGLRTQHTGYDRIFLLGNAHWRDYEVTVPVTIHLSTRLPDRQVATMVWGSSCVLPATSPADIETFQQASPNGATNTLAPSPGCAGRSAPICRRRNNSIAATTTSISTTVIFI